MNREQRERVTDLGRAFQSALEEIIDMGEDRPRAELVEDRGGYEVREDEPITLEQPIPMEQPIIGNKAHYQPEISHVNNGFIVRMGCQQFVFETYDKMSKYLKMYFEDPNGTENKFHANELFK
jgi:hypothetical protein